MYPATPSYFSHPLDVLRAELPDDTTPLADYTFQPLPQAGAMSMAYRSLALAEFTTSGPSVGAGTFAHFPPPQGQIFQGMPGIWAMGLGLQTGTYVKVPLIKMGA